MSNILQFNKFQKSTIEELNYIKELNKLKGELLDLHFSGSVLICIKNITIYDIGIDCFNNILVKYTNNLIAESSYELVIIVNNIKTIENDNFENCIIFNMTDNSKISFLVGGIND